MVIKYQTTLKCNNFGSDREDPSSRGLLRKHVATIQDPVYFLYIYIVLIGCF